MKKAFFVAALLALASGLAFAQGLPPVTAAPVADGVVAPSEYTKTLSANGISAHFARSADGATLYVAVQAPSTGWVAIGLGTKVMNGAYMVLGYDAGGKGSVSEETGVGRSHQPNKDKKIIAWAVKEADKTTTLEFSIPSGSYLSGASLPFILAYGRADNFTSIHAARAASELPLK